MREIQTHQRQIPELLAPAGSLEKLKTAVRYGADAVYFAGQSFGLRAAADNFTDGEIFEGLDFAHRHGAKAYVVLNAFLHDEELKRLPQFLDLLSEAKVDAAIVSDFGVIDTVLHHGKIPVHLSTQASCLNVEAARFWKAQGVERIVLGREVALHEACQIRRDADIEIEMFIHGAMCMAYSGQCVISNYTQGRDSNRGGCAQSCRFDYALKDPATNEGLGIPAQPWFSSRDLRGLARIPEYVAAGIDSVKVEGRMKSPLYAATVTKVYREALDAYRRDPVFFSTHQAEWMQQLERLAHRGYTEASLTSPADANSIYQPEIDAHKNKAYAFLGVVIDLVREQNGKQQAIVDVRSKFGIGDQIEVVPSKGPSQFIKIEELLSLDGRSLPHARVNSLVKTPLGLTVQANELLRMQVSS